MAAAVLFGAVGGCCVGVSQPPGDGPTVALPYPHHVPKTPGGVSLRFAMVQDVIHERFAKHGPAYYRERNRRARADLAANPPADRRDALADDLGAGLDYTGDHDEAVRVLRDKLADQQTRGVTGRGLYTTYANLGTFLIHGNFRAAMAGDAAAKDRLREGHGFIKQAIAANPDAHFGREIWQAAVVEFLLAAMAKPELLKEFDCIGDRLDAAIDPSERRAIRRDMPWAIYAHGAQSIVEMDAPAPGGRHDARRAVAAVGAEAGWPADAVPSHPTAVPFDEPVLGMIGMWRQGGGANPHFALALGEIMLRVGQRYLAWCAFERAGRLADRYWPDPELQRFLRDHCTMRQAEIESQLPAADVAQLRPRFDAELAFGQGYQRDYQAYEEQRIAAGASIDDAHIYDDFHAGRPPIASPVGPEDVFLIHEQAGVFTRVLATMVLGAGMVAFAVAWLSRRVTY
ncbi:MAG: hypothetical protein U0746_09195 [Gemmataceae bacterium]